MSIMNTYTGRKFDPMHIKPKNICLEDIAHALSYLCRGGGQTLIFYSVAQHCLNCAEEARARGWSDRMILACLLHDASEAYISDIIRPVKAHLSNYLEIEEMIMNVIRELSKTKMILFISHRLSNVVDSDCIYMMKDGIVAEEGTHEHLMRKKGAYQHLFDKQKELESYAANMSWNESLKKKVV